MKRIYLIILIIAIGCSNPTDRGDEIPDYNNNGGYAELLEIRRYATGDRLLFRSSYGELIWVDAPDKN